MAGNAAPIYPGADPLSETRAIHLGPGTALAEHCGTELLRLDVATPAEAVRAIMLEHPGARQIIEAGQWMIRDGDHLAAGDWDLVAERGRSDIYILPAGEGAGDSGIGKIFAGIGLVIFGLILGPAGGTFLTAFPQVFMGASTYIGIGAAVALSGLSKALAPTPPANPMDLEEAGSRQAGIFSHPSTLAQAGEPIPLMYGQSRAGGLRISNETRSQPVADATYNAAFPPKVSDLDITSAEYVRFLDVISESYIQSDQFENGAGAEAVFVRGDPMAQEVSLSLTVINGDQISTDGEISVFSKPRAYQSELLPASVSLVPVYQLIQVDDTRVSHVQITLHYPALADFATAAGAATDASISITEWNPDPALTVAQATTGYKTPMLLSPFPSFGYDARLNNTQAQDAEFFPEFGEVSYWQIAPTSGTVWGNPVDFGRPAFPAYPPQPEGTLLRFWVTVFWSLEPVSPVGYQYPGTAQPFWVQWRVRLNDPQGGGVLTFGPWQHKLIMIDKVGAATIPAGLANPGRSVDYDVGHSAVIELTAEDIARGTGGTPSNPALFGFQVKANAEGGDTNPARPERPAHIVIFRFGAEDSARNYGFPQWWQSNFLAASAPDPAESGFVNALGTELQLPKYKSVNGFSLDITVAAPPPGHFIKIANLIPKATVSTVRDRAYVSGLHELFGNRHSLKFPDSTVAMVEGEGGIYAGSMGQIAYQFKGMKLTIPTGYDPAAGTFVSPWDGTFQASKMYTDDPAWVLWDLLTNTYGMGIDPDRIDKWSFATASRRNLSLAPDLITDGATERRYTWNASVTAAEDGYKVASQIAACMDAQLWISTQGKIYLGQDAPQSEISRLITQANVTGGMFTYEGTAVSARSSESEVTYRDKLQSFDPIVIKQDRPYALERYGETVSSVDAPGVTSVGQATRRARHILITDETENQTVRFQIGLENSGMQPGDLIEIADASRAQWQNGSRVITAFALPTAIYIQGSTNDWFANATPNVSRARWLTTSGTVVDANVALIWVAGGGIMVANGVSSATLALPITEGAPVMLSTSTPETWRVLEVADDGEGLYTVLAVQHDATKWAAIDDPADLGTAYTFPADTWPPPGFPS